MIKTLSTNSSEYLIAYSKQLQGAFGKFIIGALVHNIWRWTFGITKHPNCHFFWQAVIKFSWIKWLHLLWTYNRLWNSNNYSHHLRKKIWNVVCRDHTILCGCVLFIMVWSLDWITTSNQPRKKPNTKVRRIEYLCIDCDWLFIYFGCFLSHLGSCKVNSRKTHILQCNEEKKLIFPPETKDNSTADLFTPWKWISS